MKYYEKGFDENEFDENEYELSGEDEFEENFFSDDFDSIDQEIDEINPPGIDFLAELYKRLPKERVMMLNMPRYNEAIKSIKAIIDIVKEDSPDASYEMEFDELLGTSLCFSIEANYDLNIYDIRRFCDAVSPADTMEIIPMPNEKIRIGFTFEKSKIFVPM